MDDPLHGQHSPTDTALAAQLARGDRDAVATLHERYVGRVYDFVYRTVRRRGEAATIARAALVDTLTDILLRPRPGESGEPDRGDNADDALVVRARLFATARARLAERLGLDDRPDEVRTPSDLEHQQAGFDQLGTTRDGAIGRLVRDEHDLTPERARAVWSAFAHLPVWHYIVLDLLVRQRLAGAGLERALGVDAATRQQLVAEALAALGGALGVDAANSSARSDSLPEAGEPATAGTTNDAAAVVRVLDDQPAAVQQACGIFMALAFVPMPVEVRNGIWRDLAARWPDPDEARTVTMPTVEPAAPPRLPAVGALGRPVDAAGTPASDVTTRLDPLVAPARSAGSPAENPEATAVWRPGSVFVQSRAAGDLLVRTEQTTIAGPAGRGRPGDPPTLVNDRAALPPISRPVRLRMGPDRRLSGAIPLVAGVLLVAAAGFGVSRVATSTELARLVPGWLALDAATATVAESQSGDSQGSPTPVRPVVVASPSPTAAAIEPTAPPTVSVPTAAAPAVAATETPSPADTPVPTSPPATATSAPPTAAESPTATAAPPTATAAPPTATAVPPTATAAPPPTTAPPPPPPPPPPTAPPPPPPTATRPPPPPPPPTQTPVPPPPPPTQTPVPPPPPTQTPVPPPPPTSTPVPPPPPPPTPTRGNAILIPINPTPGR